MILFLVTALLYALLAWLLVLVWWRGTEALWEVASETGGEFLRLLPRLTVGIVGSGFIARALPQDMVVTWLGPDSGPTGLAVAMLAGALTLGGPVVGFALGAAALKAGAGLVPVMAYVTAWSLFTLNRMLVWELPVLTRDFVWVRVLVSLPFPLFVALGAYAWLWLTGP